MFNDKIELETNGLFSVCNDERNSGALIRMLLQIIVIRETLPKRKIRTARRGVLSI